MSKHKKKVRLDLVGLDGNAFVILGAFRRQAKREGWTEAEITSVTDDAKSGDYDHLLCVMIEHCDDPDLNAEGERPLRIGERIDGPGGGVMTARGFMSGD